MPDSKVEKDYNALDEAVASLPNSWYFDSDQYAQEMKAIWQRSWVYACRADELAAPLSYRTMEIGDQNIVVLRDGGGLGICLFKDVGSGFVDVDSNRLISRIAFNISVMLVSRTIPPIMISSRMLCTLGP